MQQATCDKCSETFPIQSREKKHGKGIRETYFNCPNCMKHYTAFVTDAECREKQRQIRVLRASMSKPANAFRDKKIDEEEYKIQIDKIYAKIDKHKSSLELRMHELKQKVSS